ncbi:MAG: alpha/beta hydrolase [Novosphingobium sp.]|nr:alpha/beta hydrolase [Novosphingobium sp.]
MHTRFPKFCAIAAATLALGLLPVQASAEDDPDANSEKTDTGSIEVPAFVYPPSSLSSDEQKRAYEKSLATPGDGTISMAPSLQVAAMMRAHVNAQFERTIPWVKDRYPVEIVNETIAGVEVIRVRPKSGISKANRKRILLNLHGGAFMVGWPSVALLDAIPVAALSGIEVVTIHYRLYPEATHPAALEDLSAVYREILKKYDPESVGIFGGSAGGVITLQSIPWFKAKGLPPPGAIAPLAAGFQTAVGDSAIWNFSGGFSKPGTTLVSTGGYFGDRSRTEWVPETSPETLSDYPPTLWVAGTRAPELSGAASGHARLLKQGVESHLYIIEGGWHSSYSTAPETPESQDAMQYIAHWLDKQLGR